MGFDVDQDRLNAFMAFDSSEAALSIEQHAPASAEAGKGNGFQPWAE
jgi:hypothetical protein